MSPSGRARAATVVGKKETVDTPVHGTRKHLDEGGDGFAPGAQGNQTRLVQMAGSLPARCRSDDLRNPRCRGTVGNRAAIAEGHGAAPPMLSECRRDPDAEVGEL